MRCLVAINLREILEKQRIKKEGNKAKQTDEEESLENNFSDVISGIPSFSISTKRTRMSHWKFSRKDIISSFSSTL